MRNCGSRSLCRCMCCSVCNAVCAIIMALQLLTRSGMQRCSQLRPAAVRFFAASYHFRARAIQPPAPAAPTPAPQRWPKMLWARKLQVSPLASSSQEGPINTELIERMRGKIAAALETDMVEVQDMQGDGRHVEITVISQVFEGKSAVNRQRMVYKAIWEELQDTVHAVDAMVTRTPEEAGVQA